MRRYLTLNVVMESQAVALVPMLVPVTNTAIRVPRCVAVSLKVLEMAPLISVQDPGTVDVGVVTGFEQAYHW